MTVAGDRLKSAQQTIRIDVTRLDELMNLVGELVVLKTRLQQSAQEFAARLGDDPLARQADEDAQMFARIAGQLQDQVTGLRMLPIETVFNRFPRVVRDIAARLSKDVQLVVEGKETELDRSVLEEVGDPLGHLVRNALDHGIELTEERVALGKPVPATVRLSARHTDGRILITVEDDGHGIDPALLRRTAVEKGLMTKEAAQALTDSEALRVVLMPGFSTAKVVTEVSGRGVGMDVVRNNIERLGGWVDVASTPGGGTRVSLSLPLTLAIISALLVRSGSRVCALPLTGVLETLRVEPSTLARRARPRRPHPPEPGHTGRTARQRPGRRSPTARGQRPRLREPRRRAVARQRDGSGRGRFRRAARDRPQVPEQAYRGSASSGRRDRHGGWHGGAGRGHRGAAGRSVQGERRSHSRSRERARRLTIRAGPAGLPGPSSLRPAARPKRRR